jgi:hypothetical protein
MTYCEAPSIIRASRTIGALLQARGLGRVGHASGVYVEGLSGYPGVVRLTIHRGGERRELTLAPGEADRIAPWVVAVVLGECSWVDELPVAEYARPPWKRRNYRWTYEANEIASRLDRKAKT